MIVSTDSEEIAAIARHYGAEVPFLRPAALASDTSPDIEWLEHTLAELSARGPRLGLLQPAASDQPVSHRGDDSPRLGDVHVAAGRRFAARGRAVRAASGQDVGRARPADVSAAAIRPVPGAAEGGPREEQPWHSTPYQALPQVYVQNASLEIAWTRVVRERRTIAGDVLVPFLTEGYEGFDINDAFDWMVAERLLADGNTSRCRRWN